MTIEYQISKFFATFGYIGKIKYCPGTFGSIAAFPIFYAIMHYVSVKQITFFTQNLTLDEIQLLSLFILSIASCLFLLTIGTYFTWLYLKYTLLKDPKEVVIDEVIGQMLTITLCCFSGAFVSNSNITKYLNQFEINLITFFILPFCLFRFFDITKPWPINWLDQNISGAIGVICDDLAAALFAAITQYSIIFIMIDWIK